MFSFLHFLIIYFLVTNCDVVDHLLVEFEDLLGLQFFHLFMHALETVVEKVDLLRKLNNALIVGQKLVLNGLFILILRLGRVLLNIGCVSRYA